MKKHFAASALLLMTFGVAIDAALPTNRNHLRYVSPSINNGEAKERQFSQSIFPVPLSFYKPTDKISQKGFDETDEVKAALTDYPGFKKLTKFSGLSAEIKTNLRKNFLPELGSPTIVSDTLRSQRLTLLIERVFAIHKISDQCEIITVRSQVPSVLTWKLTFITFTTAAVEILSDDELIALAGHEIGHLYYAADLADARGTGDNRKARIIELKADIVALETLELLEIQKTSLLSAVKKLIEARKLMGLKSITEMSPSIEDRECLITEYKHPT